MVQFKIAFNHSFSLGKLPALPNEVGLDTVDSIRDFLGLSTLSIDLIDDYYEFRRKNRLLVPENIARKSGLFKQNHEITVYVPSEHLNPFSVEQYEVIKNETTGEILKVTPYYITDNNAYVQFWENNFFFTKWTYENNTSIFTA